jgi:hypothetical protein
VFVGRLLLYQRIRIKSTGDPFGLTVTNRTHPPQLDGARWLRSTKGVSRMRDGSVISFREGETFKRLGVRCRRCATQSSMRMEVCRQGGHLRECLPILRKELVYVRVESTAGRRLEQPRSAAVGQAVWINGGWTSDSAGRVRKLEVFKHSNLRAFKLRMSIVSSSLLTLR